MTSFVLLCTWPYISVDCVDSKMYIGEILGVYGIVLVLIFFRQVVLNKNEFSVIKRLKPEQSNQDCSVWNMYFLVPLDHTFEV